MSKPVWVTYSCTVCTSFKRLKETEKQKYQLRDTPCTSWNCEGKYYVSKVYWEGNEMEPVIKPWNKSEEVQALSCVVCGTLHNKTSDTYIGVKGAIYIGDKIKLVDSHTNDGGVGLKQDTTAFCRKESCLKTILKDFLPESVITFQDKPSYNLTPRNALDELYN